MSDIAVGSTLEPLSPIDQKKPPRREEEHVAALMFPALSTPSHGPVAFPLRPILPQKSALKGHQRSASHGGVATRPSIAGKYHKP